MPGAQCTRSRACSVESTRVSHRRSPGNHPAFPHAMVLTASFVLSPAIGLSCHRHPRKPGFRELDAGVEASGPHDFAVRVGTFRQSAPPASTASRPALMTLRNAPLSGQDAGISAPDLPDVLSKIFLRRGLDSQMSDLPVEPIGRPQPARSHRPTAIRKLLLRAPAPSSRSSQTLRSLSTRRRCRSGGRRRRRRYRA